jgi:hypothetical protein
MTAITPLAGLRCRPPRNNAWRLAGRGRRAGQASLAHQIPAANEDTAPARPILRRRHVRRNVRNNRWRAFRRIGPRPGGVEAERDTVVEQIGRPSKLRNSTSSHGRS